MEKFLELKKELENEISIMRKAMERNNREDRSQQLDKISDKIAEIDLSDNELQVKSILFCAELSDLSCSTYDLANLILDYENSMESCEGTDESMELTSQLRDNIANANFTFDIDLTSIENNLSDLSDDIEVKSKIASKVSSKVKMKK